MRRFPLQLPLAGLCAIGLVGCAATATEPVEDAPAAAPVPKPTIVSGAEWNSEPLPFPEGYDHEPRQVLIHHSGVVWNEGTNPYNRMKNLQTWGKNERNWMDVPYHFLIAPNGQIFEGRPLRYRPDTNTNFDTSGFVNVELMGSFNVQRVSLPQLESAVEVTAWLVSEYEMDVDEIQGHLDVASTGCPGEDLYRYLHQGPFNDWVRARVAGEEPGIDLLPPLENGPEEMVPDVEVTWTGPE